MMSSVPDDSLMPSWLPKLNKRIVNPIQMLWAPRLPPWAVIVHRGRRSGAEYRTPVLAWRSGATLYVVLFYGSRAQWVRNVLAADGGEVIRGTRRRRFAGVRIVRDPSAERLPGAVRCAARRLPVLVADLV
jgi:deazaflavin-dependent oxidoreductase (nitroreductase family)